ncbi:MAG: hypothetical protein EOO60_14405 [Hymenobacter sp.]|nr:MAG: hypothetical protein EOO60_14405 [Hymenobacter sp.]
MGDLTELYQQDIADFPVAAVTEPAMQPRPELGLQATDAYFNAGVLLINRLKWQEQQVSERAIAFLEKNHQVAPYADQDALNATLVGNWQELNPRFNLMSIYIPAGMSSQEVEVFLRDKVVIHFTHATKPWHSLCENRLRFLYYKYLRLSPMRKNSRPIDFKINRKLLWSIAKIKGWEWYYDYPIIPLASLNKLRALLKK